MISLTMLVFFLLVAAQPVLAAEGESTFLPGWFAWLMVVLALLLPLALIFYLRNNNRL